MNSQKRIQTKCKNKKKAYLSIAKVNHQVEEIWRKVEEDLKEEEEANSGRTLELQGSITLNERKRGKTNGRKSFWSNEHVNELIDVTCEND